MYPDSHTCFLPWNNHSCHWQNDAAACCGPDTVHSAASHTRWRHCSACKYPECPDRQNLRYWYSFQILAVDIHSCGSNLRRNTDEKRSWNNQVHQGWIPGKEPYPYIGLIYVAPGGQEGDGSPDKNSNSLLLVPAPNTGMDREPLMVFSVRLWMNGM